MPWIDYEKFPEPKKNISFKVDTSKNLVTDEQITECFSKSKYDNYMNGNFARFLVNSRKEMLEKAKVKNPRAFDGLIGILCGKRRGAYIVGKSTYLLYQAAANIAETGKINYRQYDSMREDFSPLACAVSFHTLDSVQFIGKRVYDVGKSPLEECPIAGQVGPSFEDLEDKNFLLRTIYKLLNREIRFNLENSIKEETIEELLGKSKEDLIKNKNITYTGFTRDFGGKSGSLYSCLSQNTCAWAHINLPVHSSEIKPENLEHGNLTTLRNKAEIENFFEGNHEEANTLKKYDTEEKLKRLFPISGKKLNKDQMVAEIKRIQGNNPYIITGQAWGILFPDFTITEIRSLADRINGKLGGSVQFREGILNPTKLDSQMPVSNLEKALGTA